MQNAISNAQIYGYLIPQSKILEWDFGVNFFTKNHEKMKFQEKVQGHPKMISQVSRSVPKLPKHDLKFTRSFKFDESQ